VAPVAFWNGGVIEEEALAFQRNFWGARPALQRIFETREFDDFQGRELSYAIDCLDAQWIRALLSRGRVLFVAPSVLVSSLAFVPIGLWLVPAALPRVDRRCSWLLVALYLANFAVASTTGLLYRATKPLVAPLLLILLLLLVAEHRRPRLGRGASFVAVFTVSLAMSLLDRQGLFYVLVLVPLLGAVWLRTRRGLPMVLAAAAAVGACLVYNQKLGPWLIHSLNGYWPDRSFQRLDAGWLMAPGPWIDAARLLGDWAARAWGVPSSILLAAGLATAAAWAWHERRRPRRVALVVAVAMASFAAQTAMVAMMVARYPTVGWVDHRFWYYPLPFQGLVLFGLLVGLELLAGVRGSLPRMLPALLATLALANVAQWPERRLLMETGTWFSGVARRSDLLVRSLESGRLESRLDGEYRRFYFECLELFPRLAERTGAYVAEGRGIDLAEARDGRVVAFAGRQSHLAVVTKSPGRHVLAGAVLLPAGESVSLTLGERSLAQIDGTGVIARFRVVAELFAGRNDVVLRAWRPRGPSGGGRRGVLVLLPFLVWPETSGGR
jgi:hypothetical protein